MCVWTCHTFFIEIKVEKGITRYLEMFGDHTFDIKGEKFIRFSPDQSSRCIRYSYIQTERFNFQQEGGILF